MQSEDDNTTDRQDGNDWSILFDALDAFEAGFTLVRAQPAQERRDDLTTEQAPSPNTD